MNPSPVQIFFKTLWQHFYDDLGKVILLNIIWGVFSITLIGAPPAIFALYHWINKQVQYNDPEIKEFFAALIIWWKKSYLVCLIMFVFFAMLTGSIWFYIVKIPDWGVWALIPAGLCFWLGVYTSIAQAFLIPIIIHQSIPIKLAVKRSLMAPLVKPGVSMCVFILQLILIFLSISVPPVIIVISGSLWAIIGTTGLLVVLDECEL